MKIFEDSDDSTEADPFQDRDGDFGSDKDFDPQGDTSGSESSRIFYRQKSSKPAAKLHSKSVGISTRQPSTDFSSDSSDDDSDTPSTKSDCTQRSMDTPSPQTTTQSRIQEADIENDSSSSDQIFPLAKRLKLFKASTVTESHDEIIQEIPGCSAPQNLLQNIGLNTSNLLQPTSVETAPENLLPASTNASRNDTLSTLSLISNVIAENLDHEGGFRSLDKLPPLFDSSQNGSLDISNLMPISHDVAENNQHGVVLVERRLSGELPTSPNVLENWSEGQAYPPETTTNEEDWVQTITTIPDFNFDTDSVGVKFILDDNTTVFDVFNHLFPPIIVDYLVDCTNAYGANMCQSNKPKTRYSRSYSFKPTDRNEMLKFLGLCLLSGQINVPEKRKLFTLSDSLYYHPIFVSTMSGRRFEQLLRCLYTAPLSAKGKDKIIEFMDAITRNFQACYSPEKELSPDESLLLFRGRLSFRQYIKSKKARYGIKFYELTEANGYVLNIIMYTGKDDSTEKGKKTEKTVLKLMKPYILKGHELFMDNYYNSYGLSQKLLDLKTHTNGTLRTNRKENPKEVMKKKLKKGEHVWVRKNNVYVSKWVDKRTVTMITTRDHPKLVNIANRRGLLKRKPVEVVSYNQFMSGIDRADQMVSYYSSPRKCLRWYKKVFFHLLDLAVWNSFYLYRKYKMNNSKKYEFFNFREELIRKFIGPAH